MSDVTDVVDAQLEAYVARDLERFVTCYSSDVVITNATGTVMAQGHDGMGQMYGPLFENSPQLTARLTNRIVVGNFVVDHEEIEGFNLPGSPESFQAIAVYQVADGKISRVALYF